jgi:hypothetical protein
MSDVSARSPWHIPDETWAELGCPSPDPPPAAPPAGASAVSPAGFVSCLVTFLAIGLGTLVLVLGWAASPPGWVFAGYALAVAVSGAAGGYCLARPFRGRLRAGRSSPQQAPGVAGAPRETARASAARPGGFAPQHILYEAAAQEEMLGEHGADGSPSTGVSARVRELEEELLALCRGNRKLARRLLEHERRRCPDLGGLNLLGRTIDRYRADNR